MTPWQSKVRLSELPIAVMPASPFVALRCCGKCCARLISCQARQQAHQWPFRRAASYSENLCLVAELSAAPHSLLHRPCAQNHGPHRRTL